MAFWHGLAKLIIRLLDSLVDFCVLTLVVVMLLLGGYSLWDANQIYEAAEAVHYEAYVPVEGDTTSFEELVAINPEVIGWLRVNETHINYPLLQAEDNQKYVYEDVEGNYSLSGAIFLDCMAAPDFSEFNNVIYGHHMEKNKMFGDIGLFTDKKFFDSHPYGNLFFNGKDHGIEFFAYLLVDAYDEMFARVHDEPEKWQPYLDRILAESMHTREMDVTINDRLVLLSTCTSEITNGRNILVGRLTDTVYPEPVEEKFFGTGVDILVDDGDEIPQWLMYLGWAILILFVLIVILKIVEWYKRRKRKEDERNERKKKR